jgi:hypothetical protein
MKHEVKNIKSWAEDISEACDVIMGSMGKKITDEETIDNELSAINIYIQNLQQNLSLVVNERANGMKHRAVQRNLDLAHQFGNDPELSQAFRDMAFDGMDE